MDTSSATVAGDAFGNSISSLNWFDMRLDRGLSDFNVGRTLVVNGTWDIPTAKSFSGPEKWIADGWELGLILTRSEEHTSELQSRLHLVCRLLLEKKNEKYYMM